MSIFFSWTAVANIANIATIITAVPICWGACLYISKQTKERLQKQKEIKKYNLLKENEAQKKHTDLLMCRQLDNFKVEICTIIDRFIDDKMVAYHFWDILKKIPTYNKIISAMEKDGKDTDDILDALHLPQNEQVILDYISWISRKNFSQKLIKVSPAIISMKSKGCSNDQITHKLRLKCAPEWMGKIYATYITRSPNFVDERDCEWMKDKTLSPSQNDFNRQIYLN